MNKKFFTALILCTTIFFNMILCKNIFAEDISSVSENFSQPQIIVDGKVVDMSNLGIFKYIVTIKVEFDFDENTIDNLGYEFISLDSKKQELTLSIVMVPLNVVAEQMGYKIEWNGENQKIILSNNEREMVLQIGKDIYEVKYEKGGCICQDIPPLMLGDITFVPVSVFDLLNYSYEVNGNQITFTKQMPNI